MKSVKIDGEFIKLDQFLKFVGLASTGGHAKYMISEGMVEINGHVAHERGKKVRPGDLVRVTIEEENFTKTYRIESK